ncbi:MAG: hypothetical protein ACPG51_01560 [Thiolinea sp.]
MFPFFLHKFNTLFQAWLQSKQCHNKTSKFGAFGSAKSTSALDNRTQEIVTQSLARMQVRGLWWRIV